MKKALSILVTLVTCSFRINALTTKAVCNGGALKVYADGAQIGTHDYTTASSYGTFTVSDDAQVVGLECQSSGGVAAILAEVGRDYITDATWHCSNTFQSGWAGEDFDYSSWQYATIVPESSDNNLATASNAIGSVDAKWIWTQEYDNGDWRVFCRGFLHGRGGPDNAGRRFVLGYLQNINYPDSDALLDVELYIGTSASSTVSVRVKTPSYTAAGELDETFTISGGEVQQIVVAAELITDTTEEAFKAIEITATDEVVAYGVNKQRYSNDAFLALPVDALGTEYYAVTWGFAASDLANKLSNILLVGVQDGTSVQVTFPSGNDAEFTALTAPDGRTYGPGDTLTVTLNEYQTYSFGVEQDLTGTHIVSNKALVVYSGNRRAIVEGSSRDHLVEQLPSVSTWGKEFIMSPIPLRTPGDEYRFIASEDNTEITLYGDFDGDGSYEEVVRTIQAAGDFYWETTRSGLVACVVANHPILVVQFQRSKTSSETLGDPAMQIIPPVYLFTPDYTFATPQSATDVAYENWITIIIKDSDKSGLKYNGEYIPESDFSPITGSEQYLGNLFSIANIQIESTGTHRVNHDSMAVSFGSYLYGFGDKETYATAAGYRLTPINQVCETVAGRDGDGLDNNCDGSIDEEDCTIGLYTPYLRLLCDDAGPMSHVSLSSSSQWDETGDWYHGVANGCLDTQRTDLITGAWSALYNDASQWIQADLVEARIITGIVTQGRADPIYNQWVTSYKILYSNDGDSWQTVTDESGADVTFTGNSDLDTKVTNKLPVSITSRYIRLQPQTWNRHVSLRWEVMGHFVNFAVDNNVVVWADGVQIASAGGWSGHLADFPTDATVLAFAATNAGGAAGLIAHVPSYNSITDENSGWKCTADTQTTDDWKLAEFDTSDWEAATAYEVNGDAPWGEMTHIPGHARWIWTSSIEQDTAISCRIELHKDCAAPVPINGGWSEWGPWGACAECGSTSTQTRSRSCSNPVPQYNGLTCPDAASAVESQACTVSCDPINGGLSEWSAWSECDTQSCQTLRTRSCNNPAPLYGGDDCDGDRSDNGDCTEDCGCNSSPCQNGGACSYDGSSYQCSCTSDYTDTHCESRVIPSGEQVTDCAGVADGSYHSGGNCNEYVTCSNYQLTTATCPANTYWDDNSDTCEATTTTCEDACSPSPCVNGDCSYDGNSYECTCDGIYIGANCDETACTAQPCQNGGACAEDGSSYTCTCASGYLGTNCDETPCTAQPCQNGGACAEDGSSYTCTCTSGYLGTNCDETPCTAQPCQNGGACAEDGSSYTCTCTSGYLGTNCDETPCTAQPCQNGGACAEDGSSFTCTCTSGYLGTNCDEIESVCTTNNPCENGGVCTPDGDSYTCACTDAYTGTNCDEVVTPCTSEPCENDGSCSIDGDSYFCNCTDGYSGTNCESEDGNQGNAENRQGDNNSLVDTLNPSTGSLMAIIATVACVVGLIAIAGCFIAAARRRKKKKDEEEKETARQAEAQADQDDTDDWVGETETLECGQNNSQSNFRPAPVQTVNW